MGWAKYYEDNMSIYIERIVMRDVAPVYCNKRENKIPSANNLPSRCQAGNNNKTDDKLIMPQKSSGRKGLKVVFPNGANDRLIRIMQMNGWWWSKTDACWYNRDTSGNRKSAKALDVVGAKLFVVE